MDTSPTESPALAGPREWAALATLTLPALLASMDLSVLFMAAPWISADLQPTASQLLWIMDIYGFMMAGLLVTMGTLGDRIGRRRMLLIGAVAFGAASILAAFATSAAMLLAARALLGIGGATLAPSTLSLIRGIFADENQRRTAVGAWTAAFSGGVAIGPIVGGLLLERFSWGAVFLINVPVMALLLIVVPILIREQRDPTGGRFDLLGAALSLAAILPVVYAIKRFATEGADATAVAALLVGIVFVGAFVRRQLTARAPMIDLRLFARPAFTGSIAATLVVSFATSGTGLMTVTFLQVLLGFPPFEASLWMLPAVGGSIIGVVAASFAARRVKPGTVVTLALLTVAAGFALVSFATPASHVSALIGAYTLLTTGVGATVTIATSLVLTTAPPKRAGAASAVSETSNELGAALGIALLGSLSAAVYRGEMQHVLAETPGMDPASATAAGETVGGAVAASASLDPAAGQRLLASAFEAYSHGFTVAALSGALILVVAAVSAGVSLRGIGRHGADVIRPE